MKHSIRANIARKAIRPSTLKAGGTAPGGDRLSFTNYYMEWNGRPYFGICGEFHYSRYPARDWEIELRKMKMSGIGIVASYIFWNHHEEREGVYDWTGNRDLRRFVECCAELGLRVILRIGPFCHGEVRNGGLPDWMLGRSFEVRSNDEEYLRHVRRLYAEIGRQSDGLMFKNGGPVIGIQLENELNAAAALWELTAGQGGEYLSGGVGGAEGERHMTLLKRMAVEAGLDAPLYTATGWDEAPLPEDELLPLYGGYAYTPWSVGAEHPRQRPTGEYLFADYHGESEADARGFRPPYDRTAYPFACCEIGGGMQTWVLSRFVVEPESVHAMSLVKLAGGCNFLGYYMFHGGSNPIGSGGYLNESTTPRIGYDFQAPIGEFGQIRESNHALRSLHAFLRTFGARLAPLATVLPEDAAGLRPEDTQTLRWAARTDGRSGFLFVNNYQDHIEMPDRPDVTFSVELNGEKLEFPRQSRLDVRSNASFMLPLNFDLSGLNLRYATAQLVTVHRAQEDAERKKEIETYFFRMIDGQAAEFALDAAGIAEVSCEEGGVSRGGNGSWCIVVPSEKEARSDAAAIRIRREDGGETRLYVMAKAEADRLWTFEENGRARVLFSEVPLAPVPDGLQFYSRGRREFEFREYNGGAHGDGFKRRRVAVPERKVEIGIAHVRPGKAVLTFDPSLLDETDEVLLSIEYTGNVGYAFAEGKLFHDHFYNGGLWEIGLSRFREALTGGEIVLETTPLRKGKTNIAEDAAMAVRQSFEGEAAAEFRRIEAEPVYTVTLNIPPAADAGLGTPRAEEME
ncbi:beta-galactosidase [Saccharibacillus sp. CPCC 101409]|uniref:beta-galactosidase n=1 Tax=Saccharibacillus sp. CPCC 101409 TaxID=3058041 RepID=UPI002671AFF9|nr:beta-galactosidase [Saccharibacillus sp. CPCC 101409]MDO3409294.1 beta-galactosidase [Saccharibacillus sp. CPCC 101409]